MVVKWRVDTGRVLDYLEDRPDFDASRQHYLGMSYGGVYTPIVLLFEERFNSVVFLSGGFAPYAPPHSDGINDLDRIGLPVLMLNGEHDYLIPVAAQETLLPKIGCGPGQEICSI